MFKKYGILLQKLPMNLFFYMALAPYDFDAGQRHYAGHWKSWAMKVETHQNHNGPRHIINRFINS